MLEALFRAVCLVALLVGITLLPWWAIGALALLLLAGGAVANRTRRTRIAGSTVVITGASSGLGKALALEAAHRRAARVVILARSEEKLEQTAEEIRSRSPWCTAVVMPCDVSDPEAVAATCAAIVAEHGAPNLLVNNAGAGAWQHLEEGTAQDAVDHMAVPYFGAVWMTQQLVGPMIEAGRGHVLNVTSAASLGGFRAANTYGSARWAMRGLSQYLRADLAEKGIGVTLMNAAEIAGTAYFDNAPGKAGAESHARIPWFFHLPMVKALSGDTHDVARAALDGVERGTHEVLFPQALMVPVKVFGDLFPEALHASLRIGPNGRRKPQLTDSEA